MNINRRDFIKGSMAGWVITHTAAANAVVTNLPVASKKIVWVMLRGAMDALHGVMPTGDPDYMDIRGAFVKPLQDKILPMQKGFALHPAFKNCHEWYKKGEFSPVVAVASGYRRRSHFDAQDQMESGLNATNYESGWLARAVALQDSQGLAVAQTVPIALRGESSSQTWYPPHFTASEDDLLERLRALYAGDDEFSNLLESAISNRDMLDMDERSRKKPNFSYLAKNCGEILRRENSASCAMLELGGWDTHNSQVTRLNRQFDILDKGLGELKTALGDMWKNTVVIVTTEFGRTVAINGTKGTDHGTGSTMFMLGGAVKGQQILGDWPGLATENLYEGRDLMPTTDVRSWMGSVLHQHWNMSIEQIAKVFPDVTPVAQAVIKA